MFDIIKNLLRFLQLNLHFRNWFYFDLFTDTVPVLILPDIRPASQPVINTDNQLNLCSVGTLYCLRLKLEPAHKVTAPA